MNLAIQISPSLTCRENPILDFYRRVWPRVPGYRIPFPNLLELPAWVAHLNANLKGNLEFLYVDRKCRLDTLPFIFSGFERIYGSVLDANREVWQRIVKDNPKSQFVLGGYCEPFRDDNVQWLNSLPPDTDYSLFANRECIPRLALSSGCLYNCTFCTIPRSVQTIPEEIIFRNVESFRPLRFELIYLDDKTFGQASNWQEIREVYRRVREYNPYFRGFIVQSTANEVIKNAEKWVRGYHVQYVECGVESLDQSTLSLWRKPHGVKQILQATEIMVGLGRRFIPNIIFGIASDSRGYHDYAPTLRYLSDYQGAMPFFNPYFLCQYHDSKGKVSRSNSSREVSDSNENSQSKSWLGLSEERAASGALDFAMNFF